MSGLASMCLHWCQHVPPGHCLPGSQADTWKQHWHEPHKGVIRQQPVAGAGVGRSLHEPGPRLTGAGRGRPLGQWEGPRWQRATEWGRCCVCVDMPAGSEEAAGWAGPEQQTRSSSGTGGRSSAGEAGGGYMDPRTAAGHGPQRGTVTLSAPQRRRPWPPSRCRCFQKAKGAGSRLGAAESRAGRMGP